MQLLSSWLSVVLLASWGSDAIRRACKLCIFHADATFCLSLRRGVCSWAGRSSWLQIKVTQFHLLLPRPGTQLPLTAGVLLCVKLQTSHPDPCPQFRVLHAYPKSGRITTQTSTDSSWTVFWDNVFFLPPSTATSCCCIAEGWHWLSQTWLFAPLNPAKGGSAILYMINKSHIRGISTMCHKKPIRLLIIDCPLWKSSVKY